MKIRTISKNHFTQMKKFCEIKSNLYENNFNIIKEIEKVSSIQDILGNYAKSKNVKFEIIPSHNNNHLSIWIKKSENNNNKQAIRTGIMLKGDFPRDYYKAAEKLVMYNK